MKIMKYCEQCGKKLKVKKYDEPESNVQIEKYNPYTGKEKDYQRIRVRCPNLSIFNGHTEEFYETYNGGKKWHEADSGGYD